MVWSISGWACIVKTVQNIHNSTDNLVRVSETADKTLTYINKVTGLTTGSAGVAKGTVDVIEAVACTDGVCSVVSGVGVCADCLSIATSFVPGPNITSVLTVPVSVGCKVFVYCCKKAKHVPWGC